jgi:hypothetical protein
VVESSPPPGAPSLVEGDVSAAKSETSREIGAPPPLGLIDSLRLRAHRFSKRHGHKLWWLHSLYAFALGMTVVFFARKGYDHARWLAVSVGLAWLLVVFFFRVFGSGSREQGYATAASGGRLRFLVMTYVLKNLYQGMLFFLLPFYWQSATLTSPHAWFLALLATCALLSTMDVVFDRIVMRWRVIASVFHAFILFGTLDLILPAFLHDTRAIVTLCASAGISAAAFWTLHVPFSAFREKTFVAVFVASIAAASGSAAALRRAFPPVPMYVVHGAVGPAVLADGRLTMEVDRVHHSVVSALIAVTDVTIPTGRGDRLLHVWRHDGRDVYVARGEALAARAMGKMLRLRSALPPESMPRSLVGQWAVDVETADGQLVGRVRFAVDP